MTNKAAFSDSIDATVRGRPKIKIEFHIDREIIIERPWASSATATDRLKMLRAMGEKIAARCNGVYIAADWSEIDE